MQAFKLQELLSLAQLQLPLESSEQEQVLALEIKSVSTSSREIGEQCLFVPLKGERFDGHDFIMSALEQGAVAFASAMSKQELLSRCEVDKRDAFAALMHKAVIIPCPDTLRFFGQCGQLVRQKCAPQLVLGAITGSCGKTSVKEMTASILSQCGTTLFTQGNFNNDVGVPLTLLRLDQSQQFAIIEQGASHLQDIARTAEFVEADYALITNVGQAHILGFGSREGVYHGKSEILDQLFALHPLKNEGAGAGTGAGAGAGSERRGGFGIVPADSEWFAKWQEDYADFVAAGKLLSFGEMDHATMQVSNIVVNSQEESLSFHLHCADQRFPLDADITLPVLGRHNAINAAAAALLALTMGATAEAVVAGLSSAKLMQGRLSAQHYKNLTVIDDAYNASFNAVIAAIDTLSAQNGVRILILGDMGELGDEEILLHEKVGSHAQGKIDLLLCIGPLSQYCVQKMGHQALHFLHHEDLIAMLQGKIEQEIAAGHHVSCLVKGSHAMHMEKVVAALQDFGKKQA